MKNTVVEKYKIKVAMPAGNMRNEDVCINLIIFVLMDVYNTSSSFSLGCDLMPKNITVKYEFKNNDIDSNIIVIVRLNDELISLGFILSNPMKNAKDSDASVELTINHRLTSFCSFTISI